MPLETLVWQGKKKKKKGAYCFYLENIIMEELNIRFAQCGHWDCWVHSGVAWLPADAERKTKQNKKTKRLFASSKRKQGKNVWPWAPWQSDLLLIFKVLCEGCWQCSIGTLQTTSLIVTTRACVTVTGTLLAINERSLARKETQLCFPFILLCFLNWNLISIECYLDEC